MIERTLLPWHLYGNKLIDTGKECNNVFKETWFVKDSSTSWMFLRRSNLQHSFQLDLLFWKLSYYMMVTAVRQCSIQRYQLKAMLHEYKLLPMLYTTITFFTTALNSLYASVKVSSLWTMSPKRTTNLQHVMSFRTFFFNFHVTQTSNR